MVKICSIDIGKNVKNYKEMKFLITERQYEVIQELDRFRGRFSQEPVELFFQYCDEEMGSKEKKKLFRSFFKKVDYPSDEYGKWDINEYFDDISQGYKGNLPRKFYFKDVISGFAYHIAKNLFGLRDGEGGIQYTVNKKHPIYYFFDPEFKIFIGRIATEKSPLEGNSFKVQTSAADPQLIGGGYGLRMYLTIISLVDYLESDSTLFTGSYNLWTKALPKYCNVWGVVNLSDDDEFKKLKAVKIKPDTTIKPKNFENFVASKFNSIKLNGKN